MHTIFLVEKDRPLRDLISQYLVRQGFEVTSFEDSSAVPYTSESIPPALLILDVQDDSDTQVDLIHKLRELFPAAKILAMTPLADSNTYPSNVDLGADVYVGKPCSPKTLSMQAQGILETLNCQSTSPRNLELNFGLLSIQKAAPVVLWRNHPVKLSMFDYHVLCALADQPGKCLSREELIIKTTRHTPVPSARSVDLAIARLRKAFSNAAGNPPRIRTIWGRGYMFDPTSWYG